jgi:hypothetical protein
MLWISTFFGSFSATWGRIAEKVSSGCTVNLNWPSLLTNLNIMIATNAVNLGLG